MELLSGHVTGGAGGGQLQVGEDGCNHARIGDDGQHPQGCTATRTTADIDIEDATQALRPCHLSASGAYRRLHRAQIRGEELVT